MCIKRKISNEYVTLDVETTGFNPEKHKIIAVAVCKIKDGNIIDEYTAFVNPKEVIPPVTAEITKITNDMVKEAETIDIVIPKLLDFIGSLPIVVHWSRTTIDFLKKNCADINISLDNEVIDTLSLCKKKIPNLKVYTIRTILKSLGDDEIVLDKLIDYARFTYRIFEMIKT